MILGLNDPAWETYPDCYGSGVKVAQYLGALEREPLRTSNPGDGGAWSQLWSRLANDDAVSLAAYAAVPHLVNIGEAIVTDETAVIPLDYLHLPTYVEIVRLTGEASPEVPEPLETAYHEAISTLADLAIGYAMRSSDLDTARVAAAALLVARGDVLRAEIVLDWDDDDIMQAQQYLLDGPAFGVN